MRRTLQDLALLSLICLFLGISGGAAKYHPDTVLWKALQTFLENGWNPQFFNYPGFVIYCHAIVYASLFQILPSFGIDWASLWQAGSLTEFTPFFLLPAHLITVAFSLLGVLCTYGVAWELTGKRYVSLLAGLLLATSFLWVTHSHYLTVDIPLAALCMATLWLTLYFTQQPGKIGVGKLVILGIVLGLATSAKYNGILVYPAMVVALGLRGEKRQVWGWIGDSLIVLGASAIAFFLTNPFILLDLQAYQSFQEAILFEANHAKTGHYGYETRNGWEFHLRHSLYWGYGSLALGLAGVGFVSLLRNQRILASRKLSVLIFPVLFYGLIGSSVLGFQRYMLPVLPSLAVFTAMGAEEISQFLQNRFKLKQQIGVCAVTFLLLVPNVFYATLHNTIIRQTDTRTQFSQLLQDPSFRQTPINLYSGGYVRPILRQSPIQIQTYLTHRSQNPEYFQSGFAKLREQQSILDWIIFDSFSHDRLLYSNPIALAFPLNPENPGWVVQISPYTVDKAKIPFSPESLYAPYLPDLPHRNQPGPLIEFYSTSESQIQQFLAACERQAIPCKSLPGNKGYYWQAFQAKSQQSEP
ncbi:MAG: glycosyltransferase family 39 protein [Desertifilum sp.]|nr:glycosyltransferase family 39 protein [Desertifilum sp.]